MHIWRRTDELVSSSSAADLTFEAAPWNLKMLFFICFAQLRGRMAEVSRRQMSIWTELCDAAAHLICVVVIQRLRPKFSLEGRALCKTSFLFLFFFLFTATLHHLQSGTASLNHDSLPFFFFFAPQVLPPPPRSEASLPRLHPSVLKADEPSLRPNAGQFARPPLGPRWCHSRSFRSTRSAEGSSQNQFCRRLRNKLSFSFFFYPLPPPRARRLSWLNYLPRRPRDHVGPHSHSSLRCRLK